jgi:hypothetical protein
MYRIPVTFEGRSPVYIDATLFVLWFPSAFASAEEIDGDALIEELYDRIPCRCRWSRIRREHIGDTLRFLFSLLKYNSYLEQDDIQARIRDDIEEQYGLDMRKCRFASRDPGVPTCRHRFVTLVEVACMTNSRLLAEALVGFLRAYTDKIWNSGERYEYVLQEWEPAVRKLQLLLHNDYNYGFGYDAMDDILPMLPYPMCHRGREHPRRRRHGDWNYRALSAPPLRRRRSLDLQLAVPGHAMIPYTPPVVSPALMLPTTPFDEVEMLAWKQEKIAQELQDVKREVRMLQYYGQ